MTSSLIYTGVGSRETPADIMDKMGKMATVLEKKGYTLRSGGAPGADTAFSLGCTKKEIYIPWKGFCPEGIPLEDIGGGQLATAIKWVKQIHPAADKLSLGAFKLHTRNIFQVLGKNLDSPSQFLLCWAKTDAKGIPLGGTRTAWILAEWASVPCFNLYLREDYERVGKLLK